MRILLLTAVLCISKVIFADVYYVSTRTGGHVGGIDYRNEDILKFDTQSGLWSIYFDGSDVGLAPYQIDGFYIGDNEDYILLSFNGSARVLIDGRKVKVKGSDIVRFNPATEPPFDDAVGSFNFYFDGSDVGVQRNIDALTLDKNGNLILSTKKRDWVLNEQGQKFPAYSQDLIKFINTGTAGPDTQGYFEMFFDGSKAGLNLKSENIDGASVDSSYLYLSTRGNFNLGSGVTGKKNDILRCDLASLPIESCLNPERILTFAGTGLAKENIQGIQFKIGLHAADDLFFTDQNTLINGQLFDDNGNGADSDAQNDFFTVSQVNGIDADVGAQIELASGALLTVNSSGTFSYDPDQNFNKLAANVEGSDSFTYQIKDVNGDTDQATVSITITGINDSPTDIGLSSIAVSENQPSGAAVGDLSTVDIDMGDSHSYTLVSGPGDTDNGSFQISGSQLVSNAVFDFETKSSYSIRVRSIDNGNLTFEKIFTIGINNVNDAPTGIDLSNSNVAENLAVGTVVGSLSTTDADVSDSHTYTLVSGTGSTDNGSFQIVGNQLQTNAVFDQETKNSYSIRVKSTDSGNLMIENTFTVTVTNVNEAPNAVDDSASVDEGGTVTVLTIPLMATSVSFNDIDPENNMLIVNSTPTLAPAHGTLILNANGTFSYSHNGNEDFSDSFTYEVCDGLLCDTAVVNITINPVNDAPIITLPGDRVFYDLNTLASVILDETATASDIDSSDFDGGILTANVLTKSDADASCKDDDRLGVTNEGTGIGQISVSGQGVSYNFGSGPVVIATLSTEFTCADPTPLLSITLNASATPPAVQALLRNLTYASAVSPAGSSREIEINLTDGDGGTSNTVTKIVTFDAVPQVASISPAGNATGVAVNENIVVTFSEPVSAATGAFSLECPEGNAIAFTSTPTLPAADTTVFTLNPNVDLANGVLCSVRVDKSKISDQDAVDPPDTMTADYISAFTTIDAAPSVIAVTPATGAAVATNQSFTIEFSENVDLAAGAITLNCPDTVTLTSMPSLPAVSISEITVTPTGGLNAGASCTLAVAAAQVSDSDNVDPPNTMASDFNSNYSVDSAPTLSGSVPSNGANGIAVSSNIQLSFSEAVDVTGSSFAIDCGGNRPYTLSGSGTSSITLNPDSDLPGGTICSITVNGAQISDSDVIDPPNTLLDSPTITFTTQAIAQDDSYTVTPHLTLSASSSTQGEVDANDMLGVSGSITGFGAGAACNVAVPNGSNAVTTGGGGRVVLAANGSFTYIPPQAAVNTADSFCYTVSGGDTATVTLNIADTELVWFVDAAYAGTNGTADGTQGRPFTTLVAAAGVDTSSDTIFIKNNASAYTCGITLLAGEKVIGEGAAGSLASLTGITPVSGSTFPSIGGSRPSLTASGNCIALATGNTIRGVTFGNVGPTNTALSGTGFGTLSINETDFVTDGRALNLDNGTFDPANATISSIISVGGVNNVNLISVSGTLNLGGGALTGATGTAFNVNGATSATISYSGTVSKTSTGRLADIQNRTGGSVTLSGSLTCNSSCTGINVSGNTGGIYTFSGVNKTLNTGANSAVSLTGNTGATINFSSGGLAITTTSGTGINATGGASAVNITGTGNTLASTTGTAINFANTTIGANGLTFQSISANGASTGLLLSSTGSGALTVTGTGSAGTGGTIQNSTVRGARFINASNISLSYMNFTNNGTNQDGAATCGDALNGTNTNCGAGIDLQTVNTVSFNNVSVSGGSQMGINGKSVSNLTMNNCTVQNAGNELLEDGMQLVDLSGTASITNTTFSGNYHRQLEIQNSIGTLSNLAITGSTFDHVSYSSTGGQGALIAANGTASITGSVKSSSFQNNFSSGLHVQSLSNTSSVNMTVGNISVPSEGNAFTNNSGEMQLEGLGATTYTAGNNTHTVSASVTAGFTPMTIRKANPGSGLFQGAVSSNTIGNAIAQSGCNAPGCNGMSITNEGTGGEMRLTINTNTIRHVNQRGIDIGMQLHDTAGIVVSNNTIQDPDGTIGQALFAQSANDSSDLGSLCMDVTANTVGGIWDTAVLPTGRNMRLRQRFTSDQFRLRNIGGSAATDCDIRLNTDNTNALSSCSSSAGFTTGTSACF